MTVKNNTIFISICCDFRQSVIVSIVLTMGNASFPWEKMVQVMAWGLYITKTVFDIAHHSEISIWEVQLCWKFQYMCTMGRSWQWIFPILILTAAGVHQWVLGARPDMWQAYLTTGWTRIVKTCTISFSSNLVLISTHSEKRCHIFTCYRSMRNVSLCQWLELLATWPSGHVEL